MNDLEDNILKSEILLKIQITQQKVKKLSLEIFPTLGPQKILKLSERILEQLIKRIGKGSYSLNQMILIKTGMIKYIIYLISCIEYSTIKNVTWSIIPAYNMLFKSLPLLENTEYIIVPQWEEMYSINKNVIDVFKDYLYTHDLVFKAGTPREIIDGLLAEIPEKIYLIKYSRLEKLSALHLALLGHEIGHIFAAKWINDEYIKFSKDTQLSEQLEIIIDDELKKEELINNMFKDSFKEMKKLEYNKIITSIYCELLSDIFGCALFGHTYIVAMYLFSSINADLDISNWNKGYLSWRFRLKNCIRFLSFITKKYSIEQKTYELYNIICSRIKGDDFYDARKHKICEILINAFTIKEEELFTTICGYIKNTKELKSQIFTDRIDDEQIKAALYRLKHRIIPNTIRKDNIEHPIDMRNILYAIWNISYEKNIQNIQEFSQHIKFYNLLGIKGIELSVEQEEYNDFIKRHHKEKA